MDLYEIGSLFSEHPLFWVCVGLFLGLFFLTDFVRYVHTKNKTNSPWTTSVVESTLRKSDFTLHIYHPSDIAVLPVKDALVPEVISLNIVSSRGSHGLLVVRENAITDTLSMERPAINVELPFFLRWKMEYKLIESGGMFYLESISST